MAPDKKPMFYATVEYKLWVRAELERRGWSFERLSEEIARKNKGLTCSATNLHLLVGKEEEKPVASNTVWMPAINRALDAPPPQIFKPPVKRTKEETAIDRLLERLADRLRVMTPHERRALEAMAGEDEAK